VRTCHPVDFRAIQIVNLANPTRDLGPKGIRVAWIDVDGAIDIPCRERPLKLKDEDLLKPDAFAETYWHLAHQDRSAWTLELQVGPFKEKF
jgi:hypothetical protein